MKKNINYTPEAFYNFGKQGMNQAAIAKHYGISSPTAGYHMKKPEIKKAYESGLNNESLDFSERLKPPLTDEAVLPTYFEIEQAILAAIDAHCCTISQIKFHAKFDTATNVFSVIEGMLVEGKIKEAENANTTAYFRPTWNVKKFWLTGETSLGIEFADELKDDEEIEIPETPIMTEVITEPRFKEAVECISKNGLCGTSVEEVKTAVALVGEPASEPNQSPNNLAYAKTVTVGSGQLVIGFEGNLFELGSEERSKLNQLIDLVQAF